MEEQGPAHQKPQSPTVNAILSGESEISHVGEGSFLQTRTVYGKEYPGTSHQYEVSVDHPTKPGHKLAATLTCWNALPTTPEPYEQRPGTQIYISTGLGEMIFSDNPQTISGVLAEISRQMIEQEKAKQKIASTQSEK